jgi:3-dehydroquinate synthase
MSDEMDSTVYGFSVPFEFPVVFTRDVWSASNPAFVEAIRRRERDRRHRLLLVVDSNVAAAHPSLAADFEQYCTAWADHLESVAAPVIVTGGEACKNDITHTVHVIEKINDAGLDRQSFVVVVGGGAVLDMASFAAALAHRSVRVVRLPSTVLAQGDSGFAVKNGLNLFGKKNFIGTFVPPFAVINDLRFLSSLGDRDCIGGIAEAVKVAVLRDPAFFEYMESHAAGLAAHGDPDVLERTIRRSAELHLAHICGNGDPFELGSARPLDFGHWAAHKLEAITEHRLRHGEAVALGMALDIMYSVRLGELPRAEADRILRVLETVGFSLWDDALLQRDVHGRMSITQGLREFREHLGGDLHITLLRSIGAGFETNEMDERVVTLAVGDLEARAIAARHAGTIRAAHGAE